MESGTAVAAMFANRMLREGAGNLTSSQIAERLDYYGAWLELSSSVNYGFITLYSLNKYFCPHAGRHIRDDKLLRFRQRNFPWWPIRTNSNFW